MPSLNLSKLVRRNPDRPTLKQRAAALRATAARVVGCRGEESSADAVAAERVAPADLADACVWAVEHHAWIEEQSRLVGWTDAQVTEEDNKFYLVAERAVNEPSDSPRDVFAKAKLALYDFERFTFWSTDEAKNNEIKASLDGSKQLIWTVLREAAALCDGERADAELLALETEFLAADAAAISAGDAVGEAEDVYTGPPMPIALRVYNNDWTLSGIPQTGMTPIGGGKARLHPYGKAEVEHLRANPCMGVYIGGTEGELQPDGVSRLRPDKRAQARADAIVAAWDEWQAALTAAREAVNLPALEAAQKAALLTRNAALRRIKEARAASLAGLGVKARAVATMAGECDLREAMSWLNPSDHSGRLLYSLAADVLDLTGAPTRG